MLEVVEHFIKNSSSTDNNSVKIYSPAVFESDQAEHGGSVIDVTS